MRIVIVGGGSRQWGPKLVTDILTTPSLAGSTIVLHDIDEASLPPMQRYVDLLTAQLGVDATLELTTDRRAALTGADFVAVTISTGGFVSMAHDLDVPARYGVRQSVGDTCGPGGINRSLRNIPVLVDIARDMEAVCPDAWLLNLTNPMTCLTRAVNRETTIKAVGLCHEVVITSWILAMALDVPADEIAYTVTGVNHLPLMTELTVQGEEGFGRLRRRLADEPDTTAWFRDENQLKLHLLDRFGVLPAAGDRHLAEFFPSVLVEESGWGKAWGIHLTTIADREQHEAMYQTELHEFLDGAKKLPTWQSGEMVAPVIDSLTTGTRRELPLNITNTGHVPYVQDDAVVEAMCIVDGDGIRGRDAIVPPEPCAEWIRRHAAVQELTVEAAITGDRALVREAHALDPLGGRIELRAIEAMADELLQATAQWLPKFAG
jgi:alpha-galactosidase